LTGVPCPLLGRDRLARFRLLRRWLRATTLEDGSTVTMPA
jgi:hypothetical protein